ncbi:hypothetical protein GTA08_BOTSDO08473 [Botryosphaeria dothidea]|uniref:Uncharacterized protein n=1 Tax=Botryosphaeria dothidea TaxID=55169 RepID=A0A8H4IM91_9PEZI|nr:hypothetical protein GTA08_BOTSDO08473 [Botryosphaeria dothidea]
MANYNLDPSRAAGLNTFFSVRNAAVLRLKRPHVLVASTGKTSETLAHLGELPVFLILHNGTESAHVRLEGRNTGNKAVSLS